MTDNNYLHTCCSQLQELEESPITYDPVSFFILTEGGIHLYSQNFSDTSQVNSPYLISGLLSAVRALSESLLQKNNVEETEFIQFSGKNLLIDRKGNILFSFVFEGSPHSGEHRLNLLIERLTQYQELWKKFERVLSHGTPLSKENSTRLSKIVQNCLNS